MQTRTNYVRNAFLIAALSMAAGLPSAMRAQSGLPEGLTDWVACGTVMIVRPSDSTARVGQSTDRQCGDAQVTFTVDSAWPDGVSLAVRARSPRRVYRLPMRLFIDQEQVTVFGDSTEPAWIARMFQMVGRGETPIRATLDDLDSYRIRMWQLSDSALDPDRVAVLPLGAMTLPRIIRISFRHGTNRADSLLVPFGLVGIVPGLPVRANPPLLEPATHLRDVRLVRDSARFPAPFYEGVAVLRFRKTASRLTRQLVMDRLQGEVIAHRPVPGEEPDLIVRLGPAWTDSLTQRHARRLPVHAAERFGYLLGDANILLLQRPRAPSDTALLDQHYSPECNVESDREVRRRVVRVFFNDATADERDLARRLMGGEWLPNPGDDRWSYPPMEVIGTRAEVERRADQVEHLPFVFSIRINGFMLAMTSPGGLSSVCP